MIAEDHGFHGLAHGVEHEKARGALGPGLLLKPLNAGGTRGPGPREQIAHFVVGNACYVEEVKHAGGRHDAVLHRFLLSGEAQVVGRGKVGVGRAAVG